MTEVFRGIEQLKQKLAGRQKQELPAEFVIGHGVVGKYFDCCGLDDLHVPSTYADEVIDELRRAHPTATRRQLAAALSYAGGKLGEKIARLNGIVPEIEDLIRELREAAWRLDETQDD